MAKEKVTELTPDTFSEFIKKEKPVIVDFYANWCSPCKMMAPVLQKIAEKLGDKIAVAKLNVDEAGELSMKYKISSIPCLIFFKNGKEVSRVVGAVDEEALVEKIKGYL